MADYFDYGPQFARIYDDLFPREQVTAAQIAWLSAPLRDRSHPRIVEFGVGTGRVALPLSSALLKDGPVDYIGVDVSTEMLDILRSKDEPGNVKTVAADVVEGAPAKNADLVLCVCGTISMITEAAAQNRTIQNAADTLRPGGTLIIETHNPELVRQLHRQQRQIALAIPYAGEKKMLVSFSELNAPDWLVDHCWVEGKTATFASETSRLTSLAELDEYARDAGLAVIGHYSGLDGAPIQSDSAMITGVYRLPDVKTESI